MIDAASGIDVSIVAPVHNEEGHIEALCAGIRSAMNETCLSYEIIFVNDASTDNGLAVIKKLRCRFPEFHFVDVESNVGENWALLAGMSRARGNVIVSIDGDYQNDPAYIPALLDRLDEGYRVVSGRRDQRVGNRWSRLLPSQIANTLIRLVSGVPVHDCGCGLKAYRREVVENKFVPTGFMNRFSPVALGVKANEFAEIDVIDRPRQYGESHYGLNRVFFVMRDLLVIRFAVNGPAKWLARFRVIAGFASALCLGAVYYQRWGTASVLGMLALVALINIWNLGRFVEAQRNPQFRIREFK